MISDLSVMHQIRLGDLGNIFIWIVTIKTRHACFADGRFFDSNTVSTFSTSIVLNQCRQINKKNYRRKLTKELVINTINLACHVKKITQQHSN